MIHYEFLTRILQENTTYWIVAKMNTDRDDNRRDDSILFVAIPNDTRRNVKLEEITFLELDNLARRCVENIFLNERYGPFQYQVTLYDAYDGFPVEVNAHDFLRQAFTITPKPKDISSYRELHRIIKENETPL